MDVEVIRAEMQRVAALPGGSPLSVAFYDKHRSDDALTSARIIQRVDSWREACAAAAVESNKASRTSYRRKWSEEELLDWVRRYLAESDRTSYADFSQWLRDQADSPSANTVRNTFGSWSAVLEAAGPPTESDGHSVR